MASRTCSKTTPALPKKNGLRAWKRTDLGGHQPLILAAFDPSYLPLIKCNIGQERRSKVVVNVFQFSPSSWLVLFLLLL